MRLSEGVTVLGDVGLELAAHRPRRSIRTPRGAKQARAADPQHSDRLGCGIGDVQQRDVDGRLHLIGQAVHRVGAQDQQLRAGRLHAASGVNEPVSGLVPVAGVLQLSISWESNENITERAEW